MTFAPPPIEFCVRHPHVVTGRHCTRCDRPACNDCLTPATIGSHCADCVRASRPAPRDRVQFWNAGQHVLATKTLIAINLIVYLWTIAGPSVFQYGGLTENQFDIVLSQSLVDNGDWYRLISAGFLHFGLLHLGMNMFVLWQLGQMLEPALGRTRFTLIYFASLLGGSAGALLLSPDALTGGASGAVFGLMGAAVVILHRRGVNVMRTGLGTTLILNLVITFALPGVSIGGHLGGVLIGGLIGLTIR